MIKADTPHGHLHHVDRETIVKVDDTALKWPYRNRNGLAMLDSRFQKRDCRLDSSNNAWAITWPYRCHGGIRQWDEEKLEAYGLDWKILEQTERFDLHWDSQNAHAISSQLLQQVR
jgi:hypothetical protein